MSRVQKRIIGSGLVAAILIAATLSVHASTIPQNASDANPDGVVRPKPGETPSEVLSAVVGSFELDGRSFYALDPEATCAANNPEHTKIKTWKQRVEFRAEHVLIWGMVCNDAAEVLSYRDARPRLKVSADLMRAQFDGLTLSFEPTEPKLCEQGRWCPVEVKK